MSKTPSPSSLSPSTDPRPAARLPAPVRVAPTRALRRRSGGALAVVLCATACIQPLEKIGGETASDPNAPTPGSPMSMPPGPAVQPNPSPNPPPGNDMSPSDPPAPPNNPANNEPMTAAPPGKMPTVGAPPGTPDAMGTPPPAGGGAASQPPAPPVPTQPATCQGQFEAAGATAAGYQVAVTANSVWGPLPHFWNTYGTGHLGLYLREDRGWGEMLKRHTIDGVQKLGLNRLRQHGLFHDDIGIYREENGVPVYDFTKSDQIFDFLVENGINPIVELAPMPSALAADPTKTVFDWGMIVSQPKDYNLWQELVYQFAQHSLERYGDEVVANWDWEVWNEPECCNNKFWAGSIEEYFMLYDHAAAGVRRALPNGRVGGPVASQPLELTGNSALGQKFLEHVTTTNTITPGSPGVLDFFAYHSWSFVHGAVDGYFEGLDLLDSFGLTEVPVAITEFGPTWQFGLDNEPQEMGHGAAFVIQTYGDIAQRAAREGRRYPMTYSWWVLSDVFEEGLYREDDPFIGCMGLTSRQDIHKPAYNAYNFLSQMGQEQLQLDVTGGEGVGGLATRNADGSVQVVMYNGQNPGLGPADDTYYAMTAPAEIELTINGLAGDLPYDVEMYRVDDMRGNAYATWLSQGRPSMTDMTEANWEALRSSMDSPREPLGTALCGESFSTKVSLPSPGVWFVKLIPTPGTPVGGAPPAAPAGGAPPAPPEPPAAGAPPAPPEPPAGGAPPAPPEPPAGGAPPAPPEPPAAGAPPAPPAGGAAPVEPAPQQ